MNIRLFIICFLYVLASGNNLVAQDTDQETWLMTGISKKVNPKLTLSLNVINRFTDNSSNHRDFSIDWRIKRKIIGGFSAQYLFRHWTFFESKPIYFMWYDLIYQQKNNSHRWVNVIRFHNGLDWVGREQADFIRWRNHFFKNIKKTKFVPFIGYDIRYRLNGRNTFQNIWAELGSEYQIAKTKLRLNYRLIVPFKDQPGLRRHVIIMRVFHQL